MCGNAFSSTVCCAVCLAVMGVLNGAAPARDRLTAAPAAREMTLAKRTCSCHFRNNSEKVSTVHRQCHKQHSHH